MLSDIISDNVIAVNIKSCIFTESLLCDCKIQTYNTYKAYNKQTFSGKTVSYCTVLKKFNALPHLSVMLCHQKVQHYV